MSVHDSPPASHVTRVTESQFERQLEPHRRLITLHCYRMLGSLQDAEDLSQEVLTRAWERLDTLQSSDATKAWLYRIATNACLDLLKVRKRRRTLPERRGAGPSASPTEGFGEPLGAEYWIEPAPDSLVDIPDDPKNRPDARTALRESIGLAFIAALQLLPAKQRAAFLLVEVLEWSAKDVAELLHTTVASINSLLQRARRSVEADVAAESTHDDFDDDALLGRYIATWQSGDLDAFVSLLAEDAILSMPPHAEWYRGRAAIERFFVRLRREAPRQYRIIAIRANGAPAAAFYQAVGDTFLAAAIAVLSLRGGEIAQITRFESPRLFRSFGLPDEIGEDGAGLGHPDIR